MKMSKKIVEKEVTVFIADDGNEFMTMEDCIKHEGLMERLQYITAADKMLIPKLNNLIPLNNDGIIEAGFPTRWYKVNSDADINTLSLAYGKDFYKLDKYPEIVCIVSREDTLYSSNCVQYTLSLCKAMASSFWDVMNNNEEVAGECKDKRLTVKEFIDTYLDLDVYLQIYVSDALVVWGDVQTVLFKAARDNQLCTSLDKEVLCICPCDDTGVDNSIIIRCR